jgi:phage shock protein C
MLAIFLFMLTGFWPIVGIYILAALVMKLDPAGQFGPGSRPRTGLRYRSTANDAAKRLKRKWQHLEKRIRTMEDKVTSREFDWKRRFDG